MTLPPVVIDTNVVVAGLLTRDDASPVAVILDGMLARHFDYLLSVELLEEYRRVLLRHRIRALHGLAEREVDIVLEAVVANALLQEPAGDLNEHPPDPGDRHLWALLATRRGTTLVTGDAALHRAPPSFAGVLSPAGFADLLTAQGP